MAFIEIKRHEHQALLACNSSYGVQQLKLNYYP